MAGPWEKYATAPAQSTPGPWAQYGGGEQQATAAKEEPLSWSDVPGKAIANIPSSAVKFGEAVVQPVLHPIETAKSIGNLAYGLGSKAAGAVGISQDPAKKAENEAVADAVGRFFSDRYGSAEGFKKALAEDPVGVAGDLSLVLTGGGTIAARAPGIVGRAAQATAATGRAIDPLNVASKAVSSGVGAIAPVLGVTTGTGATPIREAFDAGRSGRTAFKEHMRDPTRLPEVVGMADSAVSEVIRDRGNAYNAGMASVRANQTPINIAPIRDGLAEIGSSLTYKGIVKDPKAVGVYQEISEKFNEFRNLPPVERTAEAMDALKQAVGAIRETTEQGTGARRVADRVYNDIKGAIVKQAPEYAKTMDAYSAASDTIQEMRKTLGAGNERMTTDTALRKLQSTMRNNVNTNYGARTQLLDELAKKEPNLKPALAGQTMNDWAPRGLARVGAQINAIGSAANLNPLGLGMLALQSPRAVGEAAYGLGQGARVVDNISSAVGGDAFLQAMLAAYQTGNVLRPLQYD